MPCAFESFLLTVVTAADAVSAVVEVEPGFCAPLALPVPVPATKGARMR